jgi:hypothetical protein
MHHELKIKDCYYQAITEKRKTCELRFNDRDYQTGDTISFIITDPPAIESFEDVPEGYIHREPRWKITHILHYPD